MSPTKTKIWYAADGRDLQVRQMETSHIVNCIRLIERKAWFGVLWRPFYLGPLRKELERRNLAR